jgi:hypothetical protein
VSSTAIAPNSKVAYQNGMERMASAKAITAALKTAPVVEVINKIMASCVSSPKVRRLGGGSREPVAMICIPNAEITTHSLSRPKVKASKRSLNDSSR